MGSMATFKELIKQPMFYLKLLQLSLAISCTATFEVGGLYLANPHKVEAVQGIYCGYILIVLMEISRLISSDRSGQTVVLVWSLVGGILWITAGGIVLDFYINLPLSKSTDNLRLTSGLLALLNAVVYLAEYAIVFKGW